MKSHLPKANRQRYAEEVFLTAVREVFRRPGLVESSVSYFQMAERHAPGLPERHLSSPRWLQEKIDTNPWLEYLRGRLLTEWPRVLMHAREARRADRQ